MSLVLKGEMAPPNKRKMPTNFLKHIEESRENLKSCGVLLIRHVTEEYKKDQRMLKAHVNEILHSIFFLGVIYSDGITPDEFIRADVAEGLREEFPEPFDKYKSHLPKRTPFSILLDMIMGKHDEEDKVMEELCSLLEKLKFPRPYNKPGNKSQNVYTLESTVICVCFNSECPSKKYFGASLGCKTENAKKIMIFSSCIITWHTYVSFAIMSFTHTEENSLKFPDHVKCQAYLRNWQNNTYNKILPCKNCKNVFNLPGEDKDNKYPYGNCAETECLSKLLFHDNIINETTTITNYSQDKMTELKKKTEKNLRNKIASIPSIRSMTNNDYLPVFNPDL